MIDWLVRTPFAHRGLHGPDTGPENSLPAFAAAVAHGFGIECDVRLLADDAVVVFHDRDLARLTGRPGALGALRTEDLATLFLRDSLEHPPLLPELLRLVAGRVPLYIELKTDAKPSQHLVRRVLECLRGYGGPCCLASFDPRALAWVARLDPTRPRCLIATKFTDAAMPRWKRFAYSNLLQAVLARPHCISYDLRALPKWIVAALRRAGLPVLVWTVRTRQDRKRAFDFGDNIVFEGWIPPSPANTEGAGSHGHAPGTTKES